MEERKEAVSLGGKRESQGLDYWLSLTKERLREVAQELSGNFQVVRGTQGRSLQFKHFVSS